MSRESEADREEEYRYGESRPDRRRPGHPHGYGGPERRRDDRDWDGVAYQREAAAGGMAALGANPTIAGWIRIITLLSGILGPVLLGAGSWVAGQAYTAFNKQGEKLDTLVTTVTTMSAQREATVASLAAIMEVQRRHDQMLLEHERRLSRVEALTPLSPLTNPITPGGSR